jgi:hypothetical protein
MTGFNARKAGGLVGIAGLDDTCDSAKKYDACFKGYYDGWNSSCKFPDSGFTCSGFKEPPKNANWTSEDVATWCRGQIQAYGEKAFPFCMHKYGSVANLKCNVRRYVHETK